MYKKVFDKSRDEGKIDETDRDNNKWVGEVNTDLFYPLKLTNNELRFDNVIENTKCINDFF